MPIRLEDLKNEEPTLFGDLKDFPPKEAVKKAIQIFWFGMLGKELPEWLRKSEPTKEENGQDKHLD